MAVATQDWRKANIRMWLSLYLGWAGADRFYNGQIGWGILKAATGGGILVWWIIDALYYAYVAGQAEPARGWWWQNMRLLVGLIYGFFGVDRIYSGQVLWGIIKLITFGGFGIWWVVDNLYWASQAGKARPERDWGWNQIRMALSITLGFLGVDRAFNGQAGLAILKLITLGGFGIWWIADAAYYSYLAGSD